MSFLIHDAIAASGSTAMGQSDGTFSLVMIAVIFVVFYLLLIRPQNRKAKEHRELVSRLKKGDEVVVSGGILGTVTTVQEQYLKVSLAEGVEILIQKNAVNTVLPKGTIKSL